MEDDEHLNDEHDDDDDHNGLVETKHEQDPQHQIQIVNFVCGFFGRSVKKTKIKTFNQIFFVFPRIYIICTSRLW